MSRPSDSSKVANMVKKNHIGTPGVTFPVHISDPREIIQAYLDNYSNPDSEGFDAPLMRDHLKLIFATAMPKVTATFEFTVVRALCNRMDNMHGGAVSLVFDMCTTMAMAPISRPDFWFFGGVSRTLSVTFLRPAAIGTEVLVECELIQIGARLATISGKMFSKNDGKLLSVAEHNEVAVDFKAGSIL